jgi:hypothetical protein
MDSGRAIIAQNTLRIKHASRRKDLIEIEHALARLDLPAICFSDRTSPYRYNLQDFYDTNPSLVLESFHTIQEAQAAFIDLLRWLLILGNHIDFEDLNGDLVTLARYQAEKVRCTAVINTWYSQFEDAVARADDADSLLILNLRLWYASAQILTKAETYGPEKRFDEHLHLFRDIIRYGEQLAASLADPNQSRSFSFDLGYMIPVYLAATRCRDPALRRRAVKVLHKYPRQEGVWESTAAAAVASRWIAVEEEGLGIVTCAADIPEYRRIRFIDTRADVESQTANVMLIPGGGEQPYEVTATWNPECADAGMYRLGHHDGQISSTDSYSRRSSAPGVTNTSASVPHEWRHA